MYQLFFLSVYQSIYNVTASNFLNTFSNLSYGYKKGAEVIFNITNLTTPLVFGLGTKKEIKQLKSKDNCQQYCDGHERVSNIQYYFNNDTNITLTIPSKSILTPFAISCDMAYIFSLELNIFNGNDHLDYRYQDMKICLLFFIILYFVIDLIFTLYLIFFRKTKITENEGPKIVKIFIYVLISAIQTLFLYLNYSKNNNSEIIHFDKIEVLFQVFGFVLYVFNCLFQAFIICCSFSLFSFWRRVLILSIFFFIFSIVIIFTAGILLHYDGFFIPCIFYLLILGIFAVEPELFSLSRYADILFVIGSFFNLPTRYTMLLETKNVYPVGYTMMVLDSIFIAFTTLVIFLYLLDFFINSEFDSLQNYLINYNDANSISNFSHDEQRFQTFEDIQTYSNQEDSSNLIYLN